MDLESPTGTCFDGLGGNLGCKAKQAQVQVLLRTIQQAKLGRDAWQVLLDAFLLEAVLQMPGRPKKQ